MSAHSLAQVVVESETVRTLFPDTSDCKRCPVVHFMSPSECWELQPHNEWESHWAIYKAEGLRTRHALMWLQLINYHAKWRIHLEMNQQIIFYIYLQCICTPWLLAQDAERRVGKWRLALTCEGSNELAAILKTLKFSQSSSLVSDIKGSVHPLQ